MYVVLQWYFIFVTLLNFKSDQKVSFSLFIDQKILPLITSNHSHFRNSQVSEKTA